MKKEKGTVVIVSVLFLASVFALGGYLLRSSLTETVISRSVSSAGQAYYLAESGVNEAIWHLNNDEEWRDSFISMELNPDEGGDYWTETIQRSDIGGGSYEVTVHNLAPGYGEIVSIGKVPFADKTTKRKIKTTVFRGLKSPTHDAGIFTGGPSENVDIIHTEVNIYNGNIFSNNRLRISGNSIVSAYNNPETEKKEGKIMSVGRLMLQQDGEIGDYEAVCASGWCDDELCESCPPEEVASIIVDFDSSDEGSFRSRALADEKEDRCRVYCKKQDGSSYPCSNQCVFGWRELEDLLWEVGEGGVLRIENDVTFIDGKMELRGGRGLEVEGVLVVDDYVSVGERERWTRQGQTHQGDSHLTVKSKEGEYASGILAKRSMGFGSYALRKDSVIEGVLYAGGKVDMTGFSHNLEIRGALIGRKISLNSLYEGLDIVFDNERVLHSLGYIIDGEIVVPAFSPVLQVDHWEEVY